MALLGLLAGCPPSPPAAAVRTKVAEAGGRGVVAWVIGGETSVQSLRDNLDAITVVSPAYYAVAVTQARTRLVDWNAGHPVDRQAVHAIARTKRRALVPLVACLDRCAAQISPLLDDPAARAAHVAAILRDIAPDDVDGVFIDYEGITCSAAGFAAFVEQLARALHRTRRVVGVAITEPCGVAAGCERPGYPFDIAHLARTADHLAIMEYDFTVDGSDAVAPRRWLQQGLAHVRRVARADLAKVVIGVPFYGRITAGLTRDTGVLWSEVTNREIDGQALRVVRQTYDAERLSQVAQIVIGAAGRAGVIHFEDHVTLAERLRLIGDAGFSGVAIWRLGGEDPCNWDVLRRWLARRPGGACPPRPR